MVFDISDHAVLSRFKALILEVCGLEFSGMREKILIKALKQRMAVISTDEPDVYYTLIKTNRAELDHLIAFLTINETYFFREPAFLSLLIDRLIPERMQEKGTRPIKILSAGCATGEEPYSIAILLRERFGAQSRHLFSITAVDIDSPAIEIAKAGIYGKHSFRATNTALIARHFDSSAPDRMQLKPETRNGVQFAVINLLSDPYPGIMREADFIIYRNVSIYFHNAAQRSIFTRMAESLSEGGCLIVGASETIRHDIGLLTLVERDGLFFYQKLPGFSAQDRRHIRRHSNVQREWKPSDETVSLANNRMAASLEKEKSIGKFPQETISVAKTAISENAAGIRALFDDALELVEKNRLEETLPILEKLIASDKGFIKAQVLSGSVLLTLSRFVESRSACEAVLRIDPYCREAYLMLGIIARHEEKDEEAHRRFREALYLDASCWLAHFHLAEIAYNQKDWKRAMGGYTAAMKILESAPLSDLGHAYPPLVINAEPFLVISRHKLSLLRGKG